MRELLIQGTSVPQGQQDQLPEIGGGRCDARGGPP